MKRLFHKTHCSKRNEANRREVEGQNNKARPLVVERRTRSSTLGALTLLLGLLILLGSTGPVAAQSGDEVTDVRVEHTFGEQINFLARIQSPLSIKNATVTFQTVGGISQTQPHTVNPDGTAGYRYDASLNALPPFVQIIFWFDVTLDDGTHFTSSSYDFTYTDNRFPWQQRDDGLLRVHWYDGDSTFGNAVLNAAQRGLDAALALVPIASTGPIDVYVYATTADLHGALVLGDRVGWMDMPAPN